MPKAIGTRGRIEDLQRYRTYPEYSGIKTRINIIIQAKKNLGPREISRELGVSASIVSKWVKRYKEAGLEGLMDRPRSGQPKRLLQEREEEFRTRVRNGPQKKDGVSRFTGDFFKKMVQDEFDVSYTTSGIYRLLKRLGLKKSLDQSTKKRMTKKLKTGNRLSSLILLTK